MAAAANCSSCNQPAFKDGLCMDCHRKGQNAGKQISHGHLNAFGKKKVNNETECKKLNEEYLKAGKADADKLQELQEKFMEMDEDGSGDIDIVELGKAMERLGKHKNQLELKKMIDEVDTDKSGTINYREFLEMMLGKQSSVLRLILQFEAMSKPKAKPTGPPPKKNLADLISK